MSISRVVKLRSYIPETWEETLEMFLAWKKAQGISKNTLSQYRQEISRIYREGFAVWGENNKARLIDYMSLQQNPYTFNIRLNYLSAFFEWCISEGFLSSNPLRGLKRRKTQPRIVHIEINTLIELLKAPDLSTYVGVRDYAMFLTTLDTGIRPSEMLDLMEDDFDFSGKQVRLRPEITKTRTGRILPISQKTMQAVKELLRIRPVDWRSSPIFCSYEGNKLAIRSWENRLEHYSKILGTKIRPYDLRHTFALLWVRNGGDVFSLQQTMGHTCLSMTKRYVAFSNEELKEEHTRFSPINTLEPKKRQRLISR